MTTPQPEPARGNDGASAPDGYLPDITQQIGQAVASAVAQVFARVPVRVQQLKCSTCFAIQARWAQQHSAEIQAATEAMTQVLVSMAPDDPRRGQVGVLMFLPPNLHPGAVPEGMPQVQDGLVMVAGTIVCAAHHPEVQQNGGRREFLIASAALSPQMLAEMAQT